MQLIMSPTLLNRKGNYKNETRSHLIIFSCIISKQLNTINHKILKQKGVLSLCVHVCRVKTKQMRKQLLQYQNIKFVSCSLIRNMRHNTNLGIHNRHNDFDINIPSEQSLLFFYNSFWKRLSTQTKNNGKMSQKPI